MKRILKIFTIVLLVFSTISFKQIKADEYIDEITDFEIKVDVLDDGSLKMVYHIEWLVLDDEIGPLLYAEIGIPNSHYVSFSALTSNISNIDYQSSNGTLKIDFNEEYYEGQTAIFEFELVQDYMYSFTEGNEYACYSFTPAWFDTANVDNLKISWNNEHVDNYSPAAEIVDGYIVWQTSLKGKERYNVNIYYPSGAYNFDLDRGYDEDIDDGFGVDDVGTIIAEFIFLFLFLGILALPFIIIILVIKHYKDSGFTTKLLKRLNVL